MRSLLFKMALLAFLFPKVASGQMVSSPAFRMQGAKKTETFEIGTRCLASDTISLKGIANPIYGLALNMDIEKTSEQFLVRVVLEDESGMSYLVAEDYPMLGLAKASEYVSFCEETSILWKVVPKCLRVHSFGATTTIKSVSFASSLEKNFNSKEKVEERNASILLQQAREKCTAIEEQIVSRKKLWFAGVTPFSVMPFSKRMRIMGFGETSQTNGLEFYSGGIYDITDGCVNANSQKRLMSSSDSTCVSEFDWRNRHGKDWLTPVKDQGDSGYCTAFSAIGCLEALVNLYYNQKIDLDLSEQEAAACCGAINPWVGMTMYESLYYIYFHGVCDEAAYPFLNDWQASTQCLSGQVIPNEVASFHSYHNLQGKTEERVKKALIKYGPLHSGFDVHDYSENFHNAHAMTLYGYKEIEEGDTIFWLEAYDSIGSHGIHEHRIVEAGSDFIGKTLWKFKNSYINGGLDCPKYMYITFDNIDHMRGPVILDTPVTTMNYSEMDIKCEDADGDGYFYWGIGDKPATCPSWAPEDPDGDDSNPYFGPMDELGYMSEVHPSDSTVLYLEGSIPPSYDDVILRNAIVPIGTSFRLQGTMRFMHGAKLTVMPGGYLLIDGGKLINANLILYPGSLIVFDNGGEYMPPYNSCFNAPIGSSLNLIRGTIY